MAIKIITMVGDNYGSALQAYALQHTIKTIGGGRQAQYICDLKVIF